MWDLWGLDDPMSEIYVLRIGMRMESEWEWCSIWISRWKSSLDRKHEEEKDLSNGGKWEVL